MASEGIKVSESLITPIPIDAEIYSACWVETFEGRKIRLACHVSHEDTLCVKSAALYIKLKQAEEKLDD